MSVQYTFHFNNPDAAGYAQEFAENAGLTHARAETTVTVAADGYYSRFGQSYVTLGEDTILMANNRALLQVDANGSPIWTAH